jgi:hypothetical protein
MVATHGAMAATRHSTVATRIFRVFLAILTKKKQPATGHEVNKRAASYACRILSNTFIRISPSSML